VLKQVRTCKVAKVIAQFDELKPAVSRAGSELWRLSEPGRANKENDVLLRSALSHFQTSFTPNVTKVDDPV